LGEGFNPAWSASAEGTDLGEPVLIDGNANGWWLAPTTTTTRVEIEWTAQRSLNIAFALTALSVLACIVLVLRDRRRFDVRRALGLTPAADVRTDASLRALIVSAAVTSVAAAVFIDWIWAVPAAIVWTVAFLASRTWSQRIVGIAGAVIIFGGGLVVTFVVRTDPPFPDAGWPVRFEWLNGWTLLGVILVVGSALAVPARIGSASDDIRLDESDA
ncbi:hypothetical protein, partial [Ilumatobacter sp.]|uniref:hypothetical protein n=1 Tax=Ilumatobacter sp. TaxID=1967498 RepID=UPI003C64D40B